MSDAPHSLPAPIHQLGVLDMLAAFRSGALTPSRALTALAERIRRLDGGAAGPADSAAAGQGSADPINAIVEFMADDPEVRAQFRAADERYAAEDAADLPPLLGIPLLVKEQHDLAGHSATRGSQARAGIVAEADNPIVARLRAAGAIPFARTANPEMSCATFTSTRAWGVTRNPFNRDKTPGGSSGGSGAAVAAGFAPLATASDIAGSTRIPAAFCGLPGLKTPFGRTPGAHPSNADWYRGDHILARSVADTAYAMNTIMGLDPADHATVDPTPVLPWDRGAGESAYDDVEGLRVAVSADLGCYDVDPSVASGLARAAEALARRGAQVEWIDVGLSLDEVSRASAAHYGHLIAANMERMAGGDLDALEDYSRRFIEVTRAEAQRTSLLESTVLEARVQDRLAQAMAGFDVLLTPTSAVESLPADDHQLGPLDRPGGAVEFYWQAHMTIPFNIANRCPVMAMPAGIGSEGVPVSVQVVGHPYQDASVLPVAAALESELGIPRSPVFDG
ncbi:amidase [Brevibacterium sp. 5221]|uniref:Amidase n=1 Tax=Brevibacterium rongguiense TaxID=2695267 RepID=A0A6N9H4L5_9MICO|nr:MULTISPECIES: amidase [Brevibacterium]MYM18873.1 amidase [Brevibacterium rongguiense]WAL39388.1 amidase [Brevibacterium sp. BRM-1]